MPVSAIQREGCVHDSPCREFSARRRETAVAAVFSVLFHVAVAAVLCLFASNALGPAIRENPRVIHVTWVEASRFSGKDGPAVPVMTEKSSAVAVRQEAKPRTVQTVSGKQAVSSMQEEKKEQAAVSDNVVALGPAVNKSPALAAGRDGRHIVTLTHGMKTRGEEGSAMGTSMARPRYRDNSPPPYPMTARVRGYEGIVLVSAEILAEGRVGNLKIKSSSGYDILDKSALDAVKTWKFDPAKRMGRPVIAWVDIPVRYVLKSTR